MSWQIHLKTQLHSWHARSLVSISRVADDKAALRDETMKQHLHKCFQAGWLIVQIVQELTSQCQCWLVKLKRFDLVATTVANLIYRPFVIADDLGSQGIFECSCLQSSERVSWWQNAVLDVHKNYCICRTWCVHPKVVSSGTLSALQSREVLKKKHTTSSLTCSYCQAARMVFAPSRYWANSG